MRLGLGTDISVGYRQPLFGGVPLLLDTYTGAAAAYSLRQLRTGVTNVVRVREDSGNTEQDFTAEEITDGTLLAFVGAGNNGHVVTWYDQSGNGNDATQATAANQPKIVSAGVLVTENGKGALDFDGTNDVLRSDFGSSVDLDRTLVVVGLQDDTTDIFGPIVDSFDESPDERLFTGRSDNDYVSSVADVTITNGWTTYKDLQLLHFAKSDNLGNGQWWINGSSVGTGSNSYGYNGISIGASRNRSTVYYSGGTVQEVILYLSDQSSNRTGIEANINDHYNIYP